LDYNHQLHLITSNSKNNIIKIWSFSFKQLIEKKLAYNYSISTICVLDKGLIATGSWDTIKIWKKITESSLELVTTLTEHTEGISALTLLKNNSLVSGSWDKTIKVWNQMTENTFECIVTLNHDSEVWSLAISVSTFLISGHGDGTILIRNQTSFVLLQTLIAHLKWVWSITLLNNENSANVSYHEIMIWQKINETTYNLFETLNSHTDLVTSLAVLPNNMFASASYQCFLCVKINQIF
jgi:WD40 repeat protein